MKSSPFNYSFDSVKHISRSSQPQGRVRKRSRAVLGCPINWHLRRVRCYLMAREVVPFFLEPIPEFITVLLIPLAWQHRRDVCLCSQMEHYIDWQSFIEFAVDNGIFLNINNNIDNVCRYEYTNFWKRLFPKGFINTTPTIFFYLTYTPYIIPITTIPSIIPYRDPYSFCVKDIRISIESNCIFLCTRIRNWDPHGFWFIRTGKINKYTFTKRFLCY